jgi:hypothetical protein
VKKLDDFITPLKPFSANAVQARRHFRAEGDAQAFADTI